MARQARRTFGTLEARKSKDTGKVTSWRARYLGPDLERHHQVFGDKMAAEAWLNAERILIDRGEWKSPTRREQEARLAEARAITLRDWAQRSIAGKTLRDGTRYRYEKALEKRILPVLGDIPLKDLTRLDITSWYTALRLALAQEAKSRTWAGNEKSDGRGALFSAYQVLSSILSDAVDHELLEASPAKVKGGLNYEAVHEPIVLTPQQLWQLEELMPRYLRALVPLAASTGLRNGELRALKLKHLDLADPLAATVTVRGTAANQKARGSYNRIGEPKTAASKRTVAIPSFIVPVIKEHLRERGSIGPDDLVFPAARGGVMHASIIERNWLKARTTVGLDDLHFHDLRHTALTWAARAGATLAELMAIAGHRNPTVVLRYQHAGAERLRTIAESVGAVFHDELSVRRQQRATGSEHEGAAPADEA